MSEHSLLVIGSDYSERGEVCYFAPPEPDGGGALLGMTSGLLKSINEDVGGWRRTVPRSVYAVADAHFGARSAEVAVRAALTGLSAPAARPMDLEGFRAAFHSVLENVERKLSEQQPEDPSETTLLTAVTEGGRCFWGSFGDSRLYLRTQQAARLVSPVQTEYLGRRARARDVLAGIAASGELPLGEAPTLLLLATDGLAESRGAGAQDWDPVLIAEHLSPVDPLRPGLSALLDAALLRGGTDNICAIALQLSA